MCNSYIPPEGNKMRKLFSFPLLLLIISFVSLGGFVYWQTRPTTAETVAVLGDIVGVTIDPESIDLGQVNINGGLIIKEYEIINSSDDPITLKKIVTSCMCTKAAVAVGEAKSRFFSMEMRGDKNALISIPIPAREKAIMTIQFDPAAHGPAGVGKFDRTVWLTFADPEGVKEARFFGEVIQ
jgi:hypothetical protein